jgi:hypothetical protein
VEAVQEQEELAEQVAEAREELVLQAALELQEPQTLEVAEAAEDIRRVLVRQVVKA